MDSGNGSVVQSDKTTELQTTVKRKNPPPVPKKKKPQKKKTGRLTKDQLKLDITHTVKATNRKVVEAASGKAIPLCLPDDCELDKRTNHCRKKEGVSRKNLVTNQEAIAILEDITDPVCVIAIVGPCRTGKSYILSQLIDSDRDSQPCFKLGHLQDPETMGIWMWDTPLQYRLKDGRNISIILLDTEGIDAYNSLERGDTQMFTLSVLLSSLLIYNSSGVPRREDLNKMTFIANLAKSIRSNSHKNLSREDVKQIAPSFFWLLRDVLLEPTDHKGRPCHFRDYLLEKVLGECIDGDWDTDSIQYKASNCLLKFFTSFDAEIIPPPSTSPHVMKNIEDPRYKDEISPDFTQQVEYVRTKIFEKCEPKRGYAPGSLVNGMQLAGMLQMYVDALNSPEGIPEVGSAWDQVMKNTYHIATTKPTELYKQKMSVLTFPMEDDDLRRIHSEATKEAVECFQQLTQIDTDGVFKEHLTHLQESLSAFDTETSKCTGGLLLSYLEENEIASEKKCRSLANSLKTNRLLSMIETLSTETEIEDIGNAIEKVYKEYHKNAIGPAKERIFQVFIEELESERPKYEQLLRKIKGYDTEMKIMDDKLQQQIALRAEAVQGMNSLESTNSGALQQKLKDIEKQKNDELVQKIKDHEKQMDALKQSNMCLPTKDTMLTQLQESADKPQPSNDAINQRLASLERKNTILSEENAKFKTQLAEANKNVEDYENLEGEVCSEQTNHIESSDSGSKDENNVEDYENTNLEEEVCSEQTNHIESSDSGSKGENNVEDYENTNLEEEVCSEQIDLIENSESGSKGKKKKKGFCSIL